MHKAFSIDYNELSNSIDKRIYKLSEVKDKLIKVAFDMVRFKDRPADELWQIQSADDGDYIVAKYEECDAEEKIATSSTKCDWDIVVSASNVLNFFYKGQPIAKIAASNLGIDASDVSMIKEYLPAKLASDKNLVKALLNETDKNTKEELIKQNPELV